MGVRKEAKHEDSESKQYSVYQNEELSSCSCLDYSSKKTLMTNQNHCIGIDNHNTGRIVSNRGLVEIIGSVLIDNDSLSNPTLSDINKNYIQANDSTLKIISINEQEENKSIASTREISAPPADFLIRILNSLTHPFYIIDVNDYTIKMANSAAMIEQLDETSTCHSIIHRSSVPCWEKGQKCPLLDSKKTKKPVILEQFNNCNLDLFKKASPLCYFILIAVCGINFSFQKSAQSAFARADHYNCRVDAG